MQENMKKLRGCLEIALMRASDGHVLERQKIENAIATAGRAWVLNALLSGEAATAQALSHLGVGADTTAPATGDTALGDETVRIAVGTWGTGGLTSSTPYIQAQAQLATDEGNTTLAEVGLFNSSASGTILGHATFSTINKTTSNTLGITYTISN